jgi:hypothetical protein
MNLITLSQSVPGILKKTSGFFPPLLGAVILLFPGQLSAQWVPVGPAVGFLLLRVSIGPQQKKGVRGRNKLEL